MRQIVAHLGDEVERRTGAWLVLVYGIGHAAIIALAGGSTRLVERLLEWNGRQGGARWLKHGSGVALILGGLYFLWTST